MVTMTLYARQQKRHKGGELSLHHMRIYQESSLLDSVGEGEGGTM